MGRWHVNDAYRQSLHGIEVLQQSLQGIRMIQESYVRQKSSNLFTDQALFASQWEEILHHSSQSPHQIYGRVGDGERSGEEVHNLISKMTICERV